MNADRRKQIDEVLAALNKAKTAVDDMVGDEGFLTQLATAKSAVDGLPIEDIKDEEQESFDNMSESLQGGEKGQVMEEAISFLESADGSVQEAAEALEQLEGCFEVIGQQLEEAIDALQSAKGE